MANTIGRAATKKLLAKRLTPADPYYEAYIDDKGKQKRRKRPLPPGISKRDAAILRSVQRRSHTLDKSFQIGGLNFGWNFIIGTIPVVGDAANLVVNHYLVVKQAKKADVPASLLRSMVTHNLISTAIGLVPALGDICVAIYKPNSRNAALLEEYLRLRGEEALKLNAEEVERYSDVASSGQKKRAWFRRGQKKAGKANSVSASGLNVPPGAGAPKPNDLKANRPSTPKISANSDKH